MWERNCIPPIVPFGTDLILETCQYFAYSKRENIYNPQRWEYSPN